MKNIESIDMWRRLGLEELYTEVRNAKSAIQAFEATLENLPTCKTCAQAILLRNLQESGNKLSVQLISLGILSSALQEAVAAAEKTNEKMKAQVPAPCHCAGEPCTCHD